MKLNVKKFHKKLKPIKFCSNCVYPESSAVTLQFDEKNICSGCKVSNQKKQIDWDYRKKLFIRLIEFYKKKNNYDCIIQ